MDRGQSIAPRNRILLLLLLAYVFNFIDRSIIGILAVPIRAEFGLSDTALGGLMIAFGIVYAVAAVPLGSLADRTGRAKMVAAAVAVWSLFTVVCGTVNNYSQLALARMGVAVGEAGGIAPSYALISDYFPKSSRARALAIFSFGVPIGSALGIFFGGQLAAALSWRTAFVLIGLAGLPVAFLIHWLVAEPARAQALQPTPAGRDRSFLRVPSFWLLSLGAAANSIPGYGFTFWLPSFFHRSFDLPVGQVGTFYGSVVLVGGLAGIWLGGWLADRLGTERPATYALIPAGCFVLAVPIYATALFAPSLPLAWLLFVTAQMLAFAWLGPVVAAIQQIVAPQSRATASAGFLFITNLIGIAGGSFVLGSISDAIKATYGADSLRYSILYVLLFYLLSAAFYLGAATRLSRDMKLNDPEISGSA
ncbi:MAG TPA: MFS transporter [Sphingomicrobium sp.]|jgi:MFS family permease